MATTSELETRIANLENIVQGLCRSITSVVDNSSVQIKLSDLQRSEQSMLNLIRDYSQVVANLEIKLSKVILPSDTKYYLEEGEAEEFRANFAKLKAMIARFEVLYKNLVSYQVSQTTR